MAIEIPVVRHFLACMELEVSANRGVTIHNLIHSIVRLPGEPFPCVREQMALYALLTNGRGEHDFAIELVYAGEMEEQTVFKSQPRRIDLGQDPTMVHGLPIPRMRVVFQRPRPYMFYLLCDGKRIGEEYIEVR
jgi:hypothetical protein